MNFADRDEWGFDELHDAVDILLAEVKRLRKQVEALFSEIRRLEGDDGEWIE